MDFNFKNRDKIDFFFSKRLSSKDALGEKVFLLNQKHSDKVFIIKHPKDLILSPKADAVITNLCDVAIGVKTADCLPILIFDTNKLVIAAIHSGWKGTVKQIAIKTVKKMKEVFNSDFKDIVVMFGPAICGECYSVGSDVIDEFKKILKYDFYIQRNSKYYIDLKTINRNMLVEIGIDKEKIFIHPDCTFCKHEIYQSFRYHKDASSFQISYIKML